MPQTKWGDMLGFTTAERRGSRTAKNIARLVGQVLFAVGIASLPWGNPAVGIVVALLGVSIFCGTLLGRRTN